MSITNLKTTFLLILPVLAGCATQGIHVKVMRPALVNLSQYEMIAVNQFEGDGYAELTEKFTLGLRNSINPLTGKAFKVVDRNEVNSLLDALRGRRGKQWDGEAASLLSEWRSAEVFLEGEILSQVLAETVGEDRWVDLHGKRHTTYTRQCIADVSVLIELVHTDGDKVFDRVTIEGSSTGTTSAVDHVPELIDEEFLLDQARDQVVRRYLRRIVPHEEYVQVRLYQDGSFPDLVVGNGYAQAGSWDRALQSYRRALEQMDGEYAAYRYKALFNIGVGLEYTDQFEQARRALRDAYALEQDRMILSEIQNVDQREREFDALLQQGMQLAQPVR